MSKRKRSQDFDNEVTRCTDITQNTERLARELCAFQGHDPDALVFPGRPDTIRTATDQAFIIPEDRLLIRAWQLFEPQALAVRHLKTSGLLG